MSAWTKEDGRLLQLAAADICERTTHALRANLCQDVTRPLGIAIDLIRGVGDCESEYRRALRICGLAPADIDAAVAAIARGEHPPDSLPGQAVAYRGRVVREAARILGSYREHHCDGEVKALGHVLSLLGCEVPK